MRREHKPGTRLAAIPIAALAALAASPALAQEGAGVIVVTSARDGERPLLDYPGGVTVIGEEELDARAFRDLSALSYASPNVSLDAIGTFKGVANLSIRGLGINSSIPSIDPAVGLFVDGVYMGVNAGTMFDMLDVERVEVLRGPQGAAFGRNTTGGAVLLRTADPSETWEGRARLSYEGRVDRGRGKGTFSGQGVISGPVSETLSFRIGALHSDDGGYFTNLVDGAAYGGGTTTILRAGLALRTDRLRLVAKGEWSGSEGDGAPGHNNGLFARDTFEIALNQRGFHDSETGFATLRAEYDLGGGTLANVFGWRRYDLSTRNDIDSTPDPIFESDTATAQEQWSNELTYSRDAGPVRFVGGLYLFTQDVGYDETRDLSFFGSPTHYGGGRQEHDAVGLFGQGEFDLAPALSLRAGLRWSYERKRAAITYVRPRGGCSAVAGTCPTGGELVPGENNGFTDARSWDALSPSLVATWRASDTVRIHAGWSRGHRSGGYNLRVTQPAAFEEVAAALGSPAFDAERVDTFELGGNWQSADGLLHARAAAFWTEVDGMQREVNVPSVASGLAQSVYNTADARIRGGELELSARPAPGLSLSAHAGATDAAYRRVFFDLTGDGAIDAADLALALPRAPEWTVGGSIGYEATVAGRDALRADVFFQHRSRYAYTDNNWGYNSASDRLDASIAYTLAGPGVTVRLFGRNLLDEVQFGGDTQLAFAAGPFSDGDNRPFDPRPAAGTFSPLHKGRTLGVEMAAGF